MYVKELDFHIEHSEIVEWIDPKTVVIYGNIKGRRVPSRILEEHIQQAVQEGARTLYIKADGQHGIGGRIWPRNEAIKVIIEGPVGQRCGAMGMFGTEIIVKGSVSDDVGWLNCGAKITVLGDATNGAFNGAAQGILYVQGSGGARCDTLTKHNPRFDPPQSWYFRDVGDSFGEFKAGGISVVCGVDPRNPENVLGYRPCVGMVGGIIYFRGSIKEYSERDVKLLDLTEQDWQWIIKNMKPFLEAIDRLSYYEELTRSPKDWKKLVAYTPEERQARKWFKIPISEFRKKWEEEVGEGGIFAEYLTHERTILPYITTGEDRRLRPVWANERYAPPCAYACPTMIPNHKVTRLIREGRLNVALELILQYSPLPSTVCGGICPKLCMEACTRAKYDKPIRIDELAKLSLEIPAPKKAKSTGRKIAIIGGGPAGMSAAWQLALKGHEVSLYEASGKLGGKIELCIPRERLSYEILEKEIERFKTTGIKLFLNTKVTENKFEEIYRDNDIVIIAVGAHEPRRLNFPGSEQTTSAYEFLRQINEGKKPDLKGKKVVVIGAGDVGMDVATEAFIYGAESVIAIDIQRPSALRKEIEIARSKGTKIMWPKITERFDPLQKKIYFTDGTSLDADYVIVAIGNMPIVDFIPPEIHSEKGWLKVNEFYQTSDPKVYAIGDVTGLGLVTHAIGHGRIVAEHIDSRLMGAPYSFERKNFIPYERIKTEYYERCKTDPATDPLKEAERCLSCGTCRDCHICEVTCYWKAISRIEYEDGSYEYIVEDDKCIGCGFCAGVCPCGVWEMEPVV